MSNSQLDLRKKLNTVTDSEGNVFAAEKNGKGYIVNCKSQNKENHFCFANDLKDLFMLFMDNDNQKAIAKLLNKLQAEPVQAEPVQAEPVQAEPKKANTMLTIKQVLQIKPVFILSVNYDAGSIGEMTGEDRDLNLYLAELTIQYHSLVDDACLAFTVECLIRENIEGVTIVEMDTCCDIQSVYANNIESLPNCSHHVWAHDLDDELHTVLVELMENQPIDVIPEHFTIEAY